MENISCVICGEYSDDVVITENGYEGVKCTNCDLIYISPRPSQKEMLSNYESDNEYGHGTSPYLNDKIRYRTYYSKTIEANNSINLISNYKKAGRVLEIGPGPGLFMLEASKRGYETTGLEINPSRAEYLNQMGLECVTSSLEDVGSANLKKVDVVYHRDAISHFYSPHDAITSMKELLNDDGILVFETGNIGELNRFWLSFYTNFHYPGHLFFFSEKSIKKLLSQCGLEVVAIKRYSFVLDLFYMFSAQHVKKLILMTKKKQTNKDSFEMPYNNKDYNVSLSDKAVAVINYLKAFSRYKLSWLIPSPPGTPAQILVVARKQK